MRGARQDQQHRQRHRVERRYPDSAAAIERPVRGLRHDRHRRLQLHRDAAARTQARPRRHLAVFNGGHALPPDAVALEAIEWMELQAMKSGAARATRRSSIDCS
jgi:hypothetical protein